MISVRLYQNVEQRRILLCMDGHAGHGAHGKDIVCAAASMLVYTAAQLIGSMARIDDFDGDPLIELSEGHAVIYAECRDDEGLSELLRVVLYTMTGFRLLAANYPEHVTIITNEAAWS